MQAPTWIILILFVIAIIFSIIMASISPTFRNTWNLRQAWSFISFFSIVVLVFVLVLVSTECAMLGVEKMNMCGSYAWILTILALAILGVYMTQAILMIIDERKEKQYVDATIPVVSESF